MAFADAQTRPTALPSASAEELYALGLQYSTGQDAPSDLVEAHKWFNLAALRGSLEARTQRSEVATFLSKDEIRAAQREARHWLDKASAFDLVAC